MFSKNVGKMDRGARVVLGLALIAAYFASPGTEYGWLYLLGGAIALITGAMGSCGLYTVLGINTCKRS